MAITTIVDLEAKYPHLVAELREEARKKAEEDLAGEMEEAKKVAQAVLYEMFNGGDPQDLPEPQQELTDEPERGILLSFDQGAAGGP